MLRSYVILAWRILGRRPFFTFVSLFGISLTLVVLMLATAFLDHAFGARAPEVNTDRMLGVFQIELIGEQSQYRGEAGYSVLAPLRDIDLAEEVSVGTVPRAAVTFVDGQKVSLAMRWVDGEFFRVFQYEFLEGGPFTDQDDAEARPVAVINHETRRRVFGDEEAIDGSIEIDGRTFRVVGVVENVPAFRPASFADVWVPISTSKTDAYLEGLYGSFQGFFVAPNRDRMPALREEILTRLAEVDVSTEEDYDRLHANVETTFDALARELLSVPSEGGSSPGMAMRWLILGLALLFMALPSLNLINLNMSRILERASEIGVRKSFGASSRTLVTQFVIENILLTLIGGVVGLVLATLALHLVSGTALVSYAELGLNPTIFTWGILITLAFGLLSGAYPAWRMSRLHPRQALAESGS
ncbi:MAG: ABC transporter permease [Acidobacteriota bacterium]